ncbi:MAG TPA: hypothetical protein VGE95_11040, partial [Arthrobacter sp.]
INTRTNSSAGGQESIFTVQGIKGTHGGMNTLRTCPNTTADSHRRIIQQGSDNLSSGQQGSGQ